MELIEEEDEKEIDDDVDDDGDLIDSWDSALPLWNAMIRLPTL